jgi:hypothetical protein
MFVWPVEALHEAFLLLLARHVQEEFKNNRPLPSEVILEVRDVEEPFVPDVLAQERRGQLLWRKLPFAVPQFRAAQQYCGHNPMRAFDLGQIQDLSPTTYLY